MSAFAPCDLVDLIEKHDAGLLHAFDGRPRDLLHVDEPLLFFLDQVFESLADLHFALLRALAKEAGQHVFEVDVHLLRALIRDDLELRHVAVAGFEFDDAVIELALAKLRAQLLAGPRCGTLVCAVSVGRQSSSSRSRGSGRKQQVENALFRVKFRLVLDLLHPLGADHVNSDLDQVTHDGFDVAPNIADFSEFRGLYLQERRVRELRQATRDLRLADARRSDHDDVLGHDLVREFRSELLAAHAVAQRDGNRALGVVLADDVLIEFGDDLPRREFIQCEFGVLGARWKVDCHAVIISSQVGVCVGPGSLTPYRLADS